jgi:beta-glucanase (GH16 family)
MPGAAGAWPAFWMLPDRGPTSANLDQRVTVGDSVRHVPVPMGNEIDIVEYQAVWENPLTGNSASHSGYIWKYGRGGIAGDFVNANDGAGPRLALSHPDTEFHTYGVHWMPNCIVWYLDGRAVFYQASPKYVSVVPEYLILNCALTQQNWLGAPLGLDRIDAALPGNMVIDYVRAWSEK